MASSQWHGPPRPGYDGPNSNRSALMPVLSRSLEIQGEISAIRRDIHAHPELAYEENRTSDVVAAKLTEWGLEVTRGLGKTGLVGTLRKGNSVKSIGLRADMDCLPMDETNDFEHRSTNPGRMHACGHDGHTAMLLGAARMLSEKFPCDAVFAIHNKPGIPLGMIVSKPGPLLAAADRWDIRITGKGGHAAHPHTTLDPMVVGASIIMSLQTIVSRNIDPIDSTVVTVGFFKAGSAYNVIPGDAHIGGTTRTTSPENRALVKRRIEEICEGAAKMYGVKVVMEHKPGYPPTVNNPERSKFAIEVAAGVCGENNVRGDTRPSMGAEDFSYMLEQVPGAMVWLGNGGGAEAVSLHNSRYDFNDMAIPFGVSFFVNTVERFLGEPART